MSERPTPETDARTYVPSLGASTVPAEFARKLERERDEARELAERMFRERAEALKEIHSQFVEYDKLFDEAEKIRVERDEAREALRALAPLTYHDCSFYKDIMGNCILCKKEETK